MPIKQCENVIFFIKKKSEGGGEGPMFEICFLVVGQSKWSKEWARFLARAWCLNNG
jgi:hypothetical protein